MTRFKTVEEVWDNMAECDRMERQASLYGPYDPRSEEVMEGWRSAEHAPRKMSADEYRKEASVARAVAGAVEGDFKNSSESWVRYLELAATHAGDGLT